MRRNRCPKWQSRHGCCDDLLSRSYLTNGLFGLAPAAVEHGVMVDASYTNFYQGVTRGGGRQTFRNGSKTDLFIMADTGKMGLWQGGLLQVHAVDWQFGENSNGDAAGLTPVNTNLLTPTITPTYGMTNLMLMQQLGGGWAAIAGRYNALDLWATFYPEFGRGIDGFMNVSTLIPLNVGISLPSISNVAGVMKMGERGVEGGFVVLETQNSPTTAGLDFPNGTTLLGLARKHTDFGGRPGSHTLIGTYATGDFSRLALKDGKSFRRAALFLRATLAAGWLRTWRNSDCGSIAVTINGTRSCSATWGFQTRKTIPTWLRLPFRLRHLVSWIVVRMTAWESPTFTML